MPTTDHPRDLARSIALGTAAAAVVTVPTLGPLVFHTREDVEPYDTVIAPPGYAFAVWAPIFAGITVQTAQALAPGRRHLLENRVTGWPLAGAYAFNTAWSVAAQSHRFSYTPALLPAAVACTGVAYRRLQAGFPPRESTTSISTGLLLGWTSLAAVVNLSAGTQLLGAEANSRSSTAGSTLAAVAAAAGLATLIRRSRRGYLPLAASSSWGLLTTAADDRRPITARIGAAAAAVTILTTATIHTVSGNRPRPTSGATPRIPCDEWTHFRRRTSWNSPRSCASPAEASPLLRPAASPSVVAEACPGFMWSPLRTRRSDVESYCGMADLSVRRLSGLV